MEPSVTVRRRWLLFALGTAAIGSAVAAHALRWATEEGFRSAVGERQRLEQRFGEFLTGQEQLLNRLIAQRQRNQELEAKLADKDIELDRSMSRLAEEGQAIHDLEQRLFTMQRQMERLQGELALVVEERLVSTPAAVPAAIELERVLISDIGSYGLNGRVLSIHREWDFVVVDLGWEAVGIGDTVSIFRNDRLLGQARIERVQETVAAATILPGWEIEEIRINDNVKLL